MVFRKQRLDSRLRGNDGEEKTRVYVRKCWIHYAGSSLCSLWLILVVVLFSGCATKWALRSETPKSPYILVSSHVEAKIGFKMSVKGFDETGTSLRSVFLGNSSISFDRPVALAVARDGRFAVADTGLRCVHLYMPSEGLYMRINGSRENTFTSPVGVAFDNDLRLYVSDSSLKSVMVFDRNGEYISTLGSVSFERPTALAYDPERKFLYVLDTVANKVYKLNDAGEMISSFGERGTEKGQFNFPSHMALSSQGVLYVIDTMNFRLQMFNDSGVVLSSFGHHGNGSGDFAMPKGVAVDNSGTIYVVDTLFDNVQLFNWQGEFLFTIGNRGTGEGEFWLPSGIFIDDKDRIYVCDTFNKRIQIFQIIRN